ncbi:MAG: hypothetical protein JW776_15650 [Candidatus Lokiarchaeota archaeon]|nr:hypothetical protein [Candidatus Lokiarchaeota archaeon]
MSENKVNNIPIEIYESLTQREIGYSLLIKGEAGTGKTTLALSILSILRSNMEAIYISTRVAPQSLYAQFPWIREVLKENNILDATRTYFPPVDNPNELKTHLLRTIKFKDAPEFLKILYDKISEYENAIVVIDSWDAIIGTCANVSQEWETVLTEVVRQLNLKLIVVSERTISSFLDYTFDGIVTLTDSELDGRTHRQIEINKIRGIERRQKRYNYTLNNNEFMYCSPYYEINNNNALETSKVKKWDAIQPIGNHSVYSTGNPELDKLYHGGLKAKSLNLWEIESDVPLTAFSHIIVPLICNFVTQNIGTIIYTAEGINSRFVDKNKIFVYLPMDRIRAYIRYLVESVGNEKLNKKYDILPYVVPFEPMEFKRQFTATYVELAESSSYSPIISVMGYDFINLRDRSFSDLSSEFYNHLKFVRNYNSIEIAIVNRLTTGNDTSISTPQQRFIENISYFFNTHIKMIYKNNVIFLYGIKPYSGIWWMKMEDEDQPLAKITLIPMV